MQNAKDTFYVMLQNRLAALNPGRTVVVRGVVRPGIVVEENELATAWVEVDAFRLRWTGLTMKPAEAMPLAMLQCQILYATDGSAGNGGMDRGRLLAAMDGELAQMLAAQPRSVQKTNYTSAGTGVGGTSMATSIFWDNPVFGAVSTLKERLERTVTVEIFAYQEAGEL